MSLNDKCQGGGSHKRGEGVACIECKPFNDKCSGGLHERGRGKGCIECKPTIAVCLVPSVTATSSSTARRVGLGR